MRKRLLVLIVIGLMAFGAEGVASASIISAMDGGWSITVNPQSDVGLYSWKDPFGAEHMYQEWWWLGDSCKEKSLDDYTFISATNPNPDQISLQYSSSWFSSIQLLYDLDGAGNSSSVFETLSFTSQYCQPVDMRVFEYTDFDLADTSGGDTAQGDISGIEQEDGLVLARVVPLSPTPSYFEIAEYDDILSSLNNTTVTNLSGLGSPFGPGDATFAYQWDFTISPCGTYTIEKRKDITIVPEPASLFLLGIGLIGLAGGRIRKKL